MFDGVLNTLFQFAKISVKNVLDLGKYTVFECLPNKICAAHKL